MLGDKARESSLMENSYAAWPERERERERERENETETEGREKPGSEGVSHSVVSNSLRPHGL